VPKRLWKTANFDDSIIQLHTTFSVKMNFHSSNYTLTHYYIFCPASHNPKMVGILFPFFLAGADLTMHEGHKVYNYDDLRCLKLCFCSNQVQFWSGYVILSNIPMYLPFHISLSNWLSDKNTWANFPIPHFGPFLSFNHNLPSHSYYSIHFSLFYPFYVYNSTLQ